MDAGPSFKIDRKTNTPFHLKLFYQTGSFHRLDGFSPNVTDLPSYLTIYTWQTCTLRELSHLLCSSLPNLLPDPAIGTRLCFQLVFPDTRSSASGTCRYISRNLGNIVIGEGVLPDEEEAQIVTGGIMAGELGGEPDKTLRDARFVIGDFISCAIFPPLANGGVAPVTAGVGRFGNAGFGGREYGGPRESGFRGPRESGFGGHRGRGARVHNGMGAGGVPNGEWRRGERVPEGPSGRGRGSWGGFGGGFGPGPRGRY